MIGRFEGIETKSLIVLPLLIAFLLAIASGWMIALGWIEAFAFLSLSVLGFGALLARPELALFLVPIAISIPKTIPRLFGSIGILEVLLALSVGAWSLKLAIQRRQIRVNLGLILVLLAAIPIFMSALAGRGEEDWARTYAWLGGCVTYLLASNLVRDRHAADRTLFWAALVLVGVSTADYLAHGASQLPEVITLNNFYRKTAMDMGENNLVAGLLAMVMPILLAYALLGVSRRRRALAAAFATLGFLLGVVLLSRTFWVGSGIGFIALLYPLWKARGGRVTLLVLVMAGTAIASALFVVPTMADLMLGRFAEPMPFSRMELAVEQLRLAAGSLMWGYGATTPELLRYGHSALPAALYGYGLVFTLPFLGMLGVWVRQAIGLNRTTSDPEDRASGLAHLGVAIGVVGISAFNDFLVSNTDYLCLAFLFAGLVDASVFLRRGDLHKP